MTVKFNLDGKTAVVTGGAGLLGSALSRGLAGHGATVVIADLGTVDGADLAARIGDRASFVETDVTNESDVEQLVEAVASEFGSIDVLVNTAYPRNENYGRPYEEVTLTDWRENLDIHLNSYFHTAHCASLVMKTQDAGGSIVNLGSIYGIQAPDFDVYEGTAITGPVEYAAIKGGILNMTRYMASYLGEYGVRVNAVSPGGIRDGQDPVFVEQYESRTPLERMAEPEDVVGAVVYLSSDASSYVTGHNLVVDGGWTIK